jgi:hypothetical protein
MLAHLDFGNVLIDHRVIKKFYPLFKQNSLVKIENQIIVSKQNKPK